MARRWFGDHSPWLCGHRIWWPFLTEYLGFELRPHSVAGEYPKNYANGESLLLLWNQSVRDGFVSQIWHCFVTSLTIPYCHLSSHCMANTSNDKSLSYLSNCTFLLHIIQFMLLDGINLKLQNMYFKIKFSIPLDTVFKE